MRVNLLTLGAPREWEMDSSDRPAGLTYDSSGIVFVADTKNNRIQKFDEDGNFVGKWGAYGTGQGQFDNPVSVSVDSGSGDVYVAHGGSKRILVFDKNGQYVDSWGPPGIGNGQFKRAVSVAFGDEDKIYVVDKDNSEIQIFKIVYQNEPIEEKSTVTKTTKTVTS